MEQDGNSRRRASSSFSTRVAVPGTPFSSSGEPAQNEDLSFSKRLLSHSRMIRRQPSDEFEDELEEELYDAFLPLDNGSHKNRPLIINTGPEDVATSFSDLSDMSVSKSALEEALLAEYKNKGNAFSQ